MQIWGWQPNKNIYCQSMTKQEKLSVQKTLLMVEWSVWREQYKTCPVCRESRKYGHDKDCELKKSLDILEKELI